MSDFPRLREGRPFALPRIFRILPLGLFAVCAVGSVSAATKTWIATANTNWSSGSATVWAPSGTVAPTDDVVIAQGATGAILVDVNAVANNFTSTVSGTVTVAGTGASSGRTLSLTGNLAKTGSAVNMTFRRSVTGGSSLGVAVSGTVINVGAGALNTTYNLNFGTGASNSENVESFTAGAMALSGTGAFVNFAVGITSGTATVTGALSMAGSTNVVNIRANTISGTTANGVLRVGSLTGGNAGTIIRTNSNTSGSTALSTGALIINGTSGVASFDGIITNGGANGATQFSQNILSVQKQNSGTQVFTRANGYTGGTTISGGTLLINNLIAAGGSGVGTGAVVVSGSGVLGGTGLIATEGLAGTTVSAGATLAPGSGGTGILTFNGANTTGAALTMQGTGRIEMELGAAGSSILTSGTSDLLAFSNAAAGDVVFNNTNIDFAGTGAVGWYKLFDTDLATGTTWTGLVLSGTTPADQIIVSGLNVTNLDGTFTGTLFVGNGTNGDYNDIYLQVVPEPGAVVLFGLSATLLLFRLRRRQA